MHLDKKTSPDVWNSFLTTTVRRILRRINVSATKPNGIDTVSVTTWGRISHMPFYQQDRTRHRLLTDHVQRNSILEPYRWWMTGSPRSWSLGYPLTTTPLIRTRHVYEGRSGSSKCGRNEKIIGGCDVEVIFDCDAWCTPGVIRCIPSPCSRGALVM
jgi:hypothetical protein